MAAPTMQAGRTFDATRGPPRPGCTHRVRAAQQLGIAPRHVPTTIHIDGGAFLVEGAMPSVRRHDELLLAVAIPEATEHAVFARS